MNKLLLSAAMVAVFGVTALAPQSASAVDGTITINGKVVAQTCTVDGNAYGTQDNVTVTLPLVLAPVLATAGATAGKTGFNLVVANCDSSLSTVQTYFSGGNIDAATGNLNNPAGGATNVQVQLLNSSSTVMPLNGANATAQQSPVVTLTTSGTTKGATLSYFAQYISKGAATAGAVNPTVQFTMIYL
ncbi:fimbrial protein [Dyella humicola]|uniref:fimbrial protein n=1 Tax=Dyella humicola TaxID=2992126 RepID=UPI00224F1759|nr:fimbrial protein [Dyella humicola]